MPIKIGKKSYKNFAAAERAVARKPGVGNPAAYTASIARAQGDLPGKRKRKKKGPMGSY